MKNVAKPIVPAVLGLLFLPASAQAEEQKTILMLNEEFYDSYPKEITDGLMAVAGVTGVDLKSMKGHAVVTHDKSVTPEVLIPSIKGVKNARMKANGIAQPRS